MALENLNLGANQLEGMQGRTAKDILAAAKVANDNEINIEGREWDLEAIGRKLDQAISLVKQKFPEAFDVDLDRIFFNKLAGKLVGESRKDGTYIDPYMFGQPLARLVHVLAHELAHNEKKVMSEPVVEGMVHVFMENSGIENGYEEDAENFKEVATRMTNGDVKKGAEMIYGVYLSGQFEKLYQTYKEAYLSKLETEAEKDEAFNLFTRTFPELTYYGVKMGQFTLKEFEKAEGGAKSIVDSVRKRVADGPQLEAA